MGTGRFLMRRLAYFFLVEFQKKNLKKLNGLKELSLIMCKKEKII
jgi:hypothetical protein